MFSLEDRVPPDANCRRDGDPYRHNIDLMSGAPRAAAGCVVARRDDVADLPLAKARIGMKRLRRLKARIEEALVDYVVAVWRRSWR